MNWKLDDWNKTLSQIAKIERQAVYSCFASGYEHTLTYYTRTTPEAPQFFLTTSVSRKKVQSQMKLREFKSKTIQLWNNQNHGKMHQNQKNELNP